MLCRLARIFHEPGGSPNLVLAVIFRNNKSDISGELAIDCDWRVAAIPSRRHSSAMLSSPPRPDSTIRIFSSAEYCLRVLRRISRTVRSAVSLELIDACLIFVPFGHDDEPEILRYKITSICPIDADVRQSTVYRDLGVNPVNLTKPLRSPPDPNMRGSLSDTTPALRRTPQQYCCARTRRRLPHDSARRT